MSKELGENLGEEIFVTQQKAQEAVKYASDSGINCSDLNHADLILEAAQRLYDEWEEPEMIAIELIDADTKGISDASVDDSEEDLPI